MKEVHDLLQSLFVTICDDWKWVDLKAIRDCNEIYLEIVSLLILHIGGYAAQVHFEYYVSCLLTHFAKIMLPQPTNEQKLHQLVFSKRIYHPL